MAEKFQIIIWAAVLIQAGCSQYLGRIGSPFGRPAPGPFGSRISSLTGPLNTLGNTLASPLAIASIAPSLGYDGCAGVASTGGSFPVTSASPIPPTGVSIVSENAIEGALAVGGALPLLGSVTVEGAFPTAGAGAVSYGCGSGAVAMATEAPVSTGILTTSLPASGLGVGILSRCGIAPGCGYGYIV